jgi:opacity protein-like surface antigen
MKQCRAIVVASAWLVAMMGSAAAADAYDPQGEPTAQAYESGFYLRGDAGWSWLDAGDDFHSDSVTAGGGIGYQWNSMFRTDLRFDHAFDYDIEGDSTSLSTITANAYLDLPLSAVVKPYVGGGFGYAFTDTDFDDGALAAALMGGLGFDVSQNVTVDIGYRFRTFFESDDFDHLDIRDHSVTAGLRFKF